MIFRYGSIINDPVVHNKFSAEAMLIMASVLNLGKSGLPTKSITHDDAERINLCIHALADKPNPIVSVFQKECRGALNSMLNAKAEDEISTSKVIGVFFLQFQFRLRSIFLLGKSEISFRLQIDKLSNNFGVFITQKL